MNSNERTVNGPFTFFVEVKPEPPGQFTATAVGLPDARATAATREDAIKQVRDLVHQWRAAERLVQVELPGEDPALKWCGWAKDDPLEAEYLEELARFRREDLERTLRELDQECSDSSSTPTNGHACC